VVAVDIRDEHHFGFAGIKRLLGSRVEFLQANVYELPDALAGETFDGSAAGLVDGRCD